jgi:uncharacterized protein YkwD
LERCLIAGTGDIHAERPDSVVIVARTKAPVDEKQLSQLPDIIATKKGKTRSYSTLRSSALTQAYELRACCAPTDRLIVVALGPEQKVEAAMDSMGAAGLPAEFTPLIRQVESSQFWVIMPLDALTRQQIESASALAPGLDGPVKALAQSRAAAFWITADAKEMALSAGVLCPSEAVAKDLSGNLGDLWNKTKQPVQQMLQPTVKQLTMDMQALAGDVFQTGAVAAHGEVAQASIRLNMTALEGLASAAKAAGPLTLLASIEQARIKGGLTGPAPAAVGGENEKALLELVNKTREDEMVPMLKPDPQLFRAAAALAALAAKDANFDAVTAQEIVAAVKQSGYPGPAQYANLAITPGKDKYDPEITVKAWMNDDNNKNKLLHKDFNTCGIGVVPGAGDEVFVVMIFTRR